MTTNLSPQPATKASNTQPVAMHLTGEAGRRIILNSAKRVMQAHAKEIKALADK